MTSNCHRRKEIGIEYRKVGRPNSFGDLYTIVIEILCLKTRIT